MTSSCQLAPSFFHSPKKVFLGLGIIFCLFFLFRKMRFKARISQVDTLMRIVQTVQKTSKTCIIQFGPEAVLFLLPPDIQDGIQIWSNVKVKAIFSLEEYRIESMRDNEIAVEIYLEVLRVALKSGLQSDEIYVKLVKKDRFPFLSFQIKSYQGNQEVIVCHDVPITLVTHHRMQEITEPNLPDPSVHLALPPLKTVQKVVDSMKTLAPYLTIKADLGGNLTLSADADTVSVTTFFHDLEIPAIQGREAVPIEKGTEISAVVRVDMKKFVKFLFSSAMEPTNVICCLIPEHALILHVLLDNIFMTYYIPLMN